MTPIAAIALLLLPDLPDLAERDRFPPLVLVNAQLGFLIESRAVIRAQLVLHPAHAAHWRRRLIENDRQLRAWELLLEAHGALAEEEGGAGDDEYCRQALARLRELLGLHDWFAGKMP